MYNPTSYSIEDEADRRAAIDKENELWRDWINTVWHWAVGKAPKDDREATCRQVMGINGNGRQASRQEVCALLIKWGERDEDEAADIWYSIAADRKAQEQVDVYYALRADVSDKKAAAIVDAGLGLAV